MSKSGNLRIGPRKPPPNKTLGRPQLIALWQIYLLPRGKQPNRAVPLLCGRFAEFRLDLNPKRRKCLLHLSWSEAILKWTIPMTDSMRRFPRKFKQPYVSILGNGTLFGNTSIHHVEHVGAVFKQKLRSTLPKPSGSSTERTDRRRLAKSRGDESKGDSHDGPMHSAAQENLLGGFEPICRSTSRKSEV